MVRIEPPLLKILQAFEYAARRCSPTVNFEVAHSLCGLLSQCGDKLSATAWDFVLNIWQFCDETEVTQTAPQMATIMDTLLSMMETLYTEHTFAGDTDRFVCLGHCTRSFHLLNPPPLPRSPPFQTDFSSLWSTTRATAT